MVEDVRFILAGNPTLGVKDLMANADRPKGVEDAINQLDKRVSSLYDAVKELRFATPSIDAGRSSTKGNVDGRDSSPEPASFARRAGRLTANVRNAWKQEGVIGAVGALRAGIPAGAKLAVQGASWTAGTSLLRRIPFAESFSYGAGRRSGEFTNVPDPIMSGTMQMEIGKAIQRFQAWHPWDEFRDNWWTQPRLAVSEYLPMASLGLGKKATLSGNEAALMMIGSARGLEGTVGDYLNQYGDTKAFLARITRGETDARARNADRFGGRAMGAATLDRK